MDTQPSSWMLPEITRVFDAKRFLIPVSVWLNKKFSMTALAVPIHKKLILGQYSQRVLLTKLKLNVLN